MKDAKTYAKKIRKILGSTRGKRAAPTADIDQGIPIVLEAVLEEGATPRLAQKALAALAAEFTDFNELRVSPPREILDCIGRKFPLGAQKAETISNVLGEIFRRTKNVHLAYVQQMPKREWKRHLLELGLSPYAAALVMLKALGAHAVPVDQDLLDCLEMNECVHPGSTPRDVQAFLERVAGAEGGLAAHAALRQYVKKSAKTLARWRKARAAEAAKAEAAAKAKAAHKTAREKTVAASKKSKKSRKAAKKTPKPRGAAKPTRRSAKRSRTKPPRGAKKTPKSKTINTAARKKKQQPSRTAGMTGRRKHDGRRNIPR